MISPGVAGASAGRLRSAPLADASRGNDHALGARSSSLKFVGGVPIREIARRIGVATSDSPGDDLTLPGCRPELAVAGGTDQSARKRATPLDGVRKSPGQADPRPPGLFRSPSEAVCPVIETCRALGGFVQPCTVSRLGRISSILIAGSLGPVRPR
jgi:hypothetical protein